MLGALVTTFVLAYIGQAPEVVISTADKVGDRFTQGIAPEKAPELTDAQKITGAVSAATPSTVTIHALGEIDETLSGREISALLEQTFVARGVMTAVGDDDVVRVVSADVLEVGTDYAVQIPGQKGVFPVSTIESEGTLSSFVITAQNVRVADAVTNEVEVGAPVVALGGTMDLQIAASVVRDVQVVDGESVITTAIPESLAPGTPLFSIDGEVIGVVSIQDESTEGVMFTGLKEAL